MGSGISIALATYNGAPYLREQLESYLTQTLLPDELVVSDDGSTDETLAIIGAFVKTAPFSVRVLADGPRLGFSDNFIRAARACEHEFIAFSDQDDVWLPDKLRIAHRAMDNDVGLSIHKSFLVNDHLYRLGILHQGIRGTKTFGPLELFPYETGFGHTFLFRRRLLELVTPENRPRQPGKEHLPLSHDHWIYTVAAATASVAHINMPLCLYRQHDANLYGFKKLSVTDRVIDRCREIAKIRSIPIWKYEIQAAFYAALAAVFQFAHDRDAGVRGHTLVTAATTYKHRSTHMLKRIELFNETSFTKKLTIYQELVALSPLAGYDTRSALLTQLKLFIFGVLNLVNLETRHE